MAGVLGNMLKASSLGTHTNTQLLKDLERNSPTLEKISDTFLQLGGRLKIVTFYETEKLDRMKDLVCISTPLLVAVKLTSDYRSSIGNLP
jgi:hypothetical protein